MKHTPGPWMKRGRYINVIVGGQDVLLAACDSMDIPDSQVEGNAALIAVAPVMFDFVAEVASYSCCCHKQPASHPKCWQCRAQALIAEAELQAG
jgi:hypothetical protein